MVKLIFLSLLLAGTSLHSKAFKLVTYDKCGGGPNGYAKTMTASMKVDVPGVWGYFFSYTRMHIVCEGSGYDQCPEGIAKGVGNDYDDDDVNFTNDHIAYAELMISQGASNGSHSVNVQVGNEAAPRIYRVVWESSSLDTYVISVYRDDI